jgi:hypothetical protein
MQRGIKGDIAFIWALPITLVGFCFAIIIYATGGQIAKHGIAWEASVGRASQLLWLFNPLLNIDAITLGHIIIACDEATATRLRRHEHAHVRQYERWGVLFPLAYLLASALAAIKGGDAYRDNVFEVEARRAEARR